MPKVPPSSQFQSDEAKEVRRFFRLYKVTLPSAGMTLRYIESDFDVTVNVNDGAGTQTFATAPGISLENEIRQRMDLQVEEMEVTLPNDSLTLGTLGTRQLSEWARNGVFDDAYVDIFVYNLDTQSAMWHSRWFMQGNPAWTYDVIRFSLQSVWSQFDIAIPRTLIQENCNNKLYDEWCAVDPTLFTIVGVVLASPAPTTTVFNFSIASTGANVPSPLTDNWLALGDCTFLTGGLAPLARMIFSQTGQQVVFGVPLPQAPSAGDQVRLRAGCNKTIDHCKNKFGTRGGVTWEKFFRGFPYVPKSDQIYLP